MKTYAKLLAIIFLLFFSVVGWAGIFPYSWAVIPIILLIFFFAASKEGLGVAVKILVASATFPAMIAFFDSLYEIPKDGKAQILETMHLYEVPIEDSVFGPCSLLWERSIISIAKKAILLAYNIDPIASFFMERQIETRAKIEENCLKALKDFRVHYPDAYDYLYKEWPGMPKAPRV